MNLLLPNVTFKIGAKSSAANLLQVAESFNRFFEDPGRVSCHDNQCSVHSKPNVLLFNKSHNGALASKMCFELPFLVISHPISS